MNPLWKVHTPNLLAEIMTNKGTEALYMPLTIFARILEQVAIRASQLNDAELNKLMVRLALYAIADPESPNFDPKRVAQVLEAVTA